MTRLVNVAAVVLTCAVVAVAADLFRKAGLSLYTEQYLAGLMALALPLLYLHVPAHGRRGTRSGPVPWYDLIAAAVSFAAMVYVAIRFPSLSELVSARPWDGLIVAAIVIVLVLEGLRRTTGMGLFLTTMFFFVLALVGGLLPGEFAAKSIPLGRLTYYSVWDSTAIMGVTLKIVATVVVIFVLFGHVLFKSGGAGFFTDISMSLMGRRRGGPAKIAILGSSLFGTISGNVVSNVMTVGVVTIPLMIRVGYRPHLAAAIEANASTGGQIMPPVMGIAAFVMAEFLQVPYAGGDPGRPVLCRAVHPGRSRGRAQPHPAARCEPDSEDRPGAQIRLALSDSVRGADLRPVLGLGGSRYSGPVGDRHGARSRPAVSVPGQAHRPLRSTPGSACSTCS
jgi:TRAP transporter 4TM/12TM fusion protein